ncbi:hypothetical protein LR392_14850 [Arthrobacter sp. AK04]|nr:hypothetical protein [Arthrobacter sp. AK04]
MPLMVAVLASAAVAETFPKSKDAARTAVIVAIKRLKTCVRKRILMKPPLKPVRVNTAPASDPCRWQVIGLYRRKIKVYAFVLFIAASHGCTSIGANGGASLGAMAGRFSR